MKKKLKKTLGLGLSASIIAQAIVPVAMAEEITEPDTPNSEVDLTLSIEQEKNVDIVLTLGNTVTDATKFEGDLRKLLEDRGIDLDRVNIQSVEAVEQNVFQGKFAMNVFWPNNGADIDTYVLFGDANNNLLGQISFNNKQFYGSTLDRDDLVGGVGEWATIDFENLPANVETIEFNVHAYSGSSLTNLRLARTIDGVQEFIIDTQKMINDRNNLTYFGKLVRNNAGGWDFVYTDGTQYSGTKIEIKSKDFAEVIRQPEWRNSAEHFIVNLEDHNVSSFDNPSSSGEVLTRLMNEDIHYIGWGTDTNKAQATNFIQRNSGNGTFVDNTNYSQSIEKIADYIAKELEEEVQVVDTENPFVLAGLPVRFNADLPEMNSNTATEEFPNGRWKLTHDPNFFENSEGTSAFNGIYRDSLPNILDRPGLYELNFGNLSPEPQFVYAHRRPIANFGMSYSTNAAGVTVKVTDHSYDPDHQTAENKGIVERKWRWKETTSDTWNDGELPENLPANKHYIVQLQVQDVEGTWSLPMTNYITTDPTITTTPIANFTLSSNELDISERLVLNDASYDPAGKAITSQTWNVYKGDQLIYTGATPLTDFSSHGVGNYTIKLKVTNAAGTVSEEFSRQLTVSEKALNTVLNDIQYVQELIVLNRGDNAKYAVLNGKATEIQALVSNIKDANNKNTAQNAFNELKTQLQALDSVEKLEQVKDLTTTEKINEALVLLNKAKENTNALAANSVKTALLERITVLETMIYNGQASLLESKVVELENTAAGKLGSIEKVNQALTLLEETKRDVNQLANSPKKTEFLERIAAAEEKILYAKNNPVKAEIVEGESFGKVSLIWPEKDDETDDSFDYKIVVKKYDEETGAFVSDTYDRTSKTNTVDLQLSVPGIYELEIYERKNGVVLSTEPIGKTTIEVPVPEAPPIPTVQNVVATGISDTSANITWDAYEGAKRYRVQFYVKDPVTGEFVKEGFGRTTSTPSMSVNTLTVGRTYKFEVTPYVTKFDDATKDFSNEITLAAPVIEEPEEPEVPTVDERLQVQVEGTTANLSWATQTGEDRYRLQLYVKNSSGLFEKTGFARAIAETTFTYTNLTPGLEYKFEVEPRVGYMYDSTKSFSKTLVIPTGEQETNPSEQPPTGNENEPVEPTPENTKGVKNIVADMQGNKATISWDNLTVDSKEITSYRIIRYVKDELTGQFKADGLTRAVAGTSYTDTYKLKPGKTYKYEIVPRVGTIYNEAYKGTATVVNP